MANNVVAYIDKIKGIFDWWTKWTGLRWWKIGLRFIQHHKKSEYGDGYVVLAEAITAWQYLNATVKVYQPALKLVDDEDDLEYIIVHELVHIMLKELSEQGDAEDKDKHEDRVATTIAWALIWVRDRAREEALASLGIQVDIPTEDKMQPVTEAVGEAGLPL